MSAVTAFVLETPHGSLVFEAFVIVIKSVYKGRGTTTMNNFEICRLN